MCLIIANFAGRVPEAYITEAFNSNPDGAGLLWPEGDRVRIYKSFNLDDILGKYESLPAPVILHFRIATSGRIDKDNTHPFRVNKRLAFVHNGIIANMGNKKESDTAQFCKLLKGLPENFLSIPSIVDLIERTIGSSKLAFMDELGEITIINEFMGHHESGSWYSNYSYLPKFGYSFEEDYNVPLFSIEESKELILDHYGVNPGSEIEEDVLTHACEIYNTTDLRLIAEKLLY